MNGVMRKSRRYPRLNAMAVLQIICINGFVAREANGALWVTTGETIPREAFEWLLDKGLLQPKGDSLFGGPSQTYIPVKDDDVPGNSASPPPPASG